jgi:ABC-type Na+ efflux pump permease subunit
MASTTPQPYNNAPGNVAPASDRYNVLSIVGFILAFVISIAGLVVSIIALSQIKKTGEKGHGLALAGVIISALAIILTIVGYIFLFTLGAHNGTTTNP